MSDKKYTPDVTTELTRSGRDLHVHSRQDVEPIVENNKRLQTEKQKRGRTFHHAASIPNNIYIKWMDEECQRTGAKLLKWNSPEMEAAVEKKLKDPEWKYLRTDCPDQKTYIHGASLSIPHPTPLVIARRPALAKKK